MIKTTAFTITAFMIGMVYGARAQTNSYYPICTPVAQEIQESWQRGEITRAEAEEIIEACLRWESRGDG